MKILIVHYRHFISGGPERYMFNVKAALERKGHQVETFSIKNSKNVESKYADYFVDNIGKSDEVFVNKYPKTPRTYIDLVFREFYSYKVKRQLKKVLKEFKPDICYLLVYKRALSPSVIDACAELNIPVVNRISDYNTVCGAASLYRGGQMCRECIRKSDWSCVKHSCVKGSKTFSIMRYLSIKFGELMNFEKKINAYVLTNGFMKEVMIERGYKQSKLHVVPTFFNEKKEFQELDKRQVLNPHKVEFLYIGNIDESKGIYDLLNAVAIVVKTNTNFHLNIVGGLHAEENKKMSTFIKDKGLREYISFLPFRNDGNVFEYYLKTNLTVLPARWAENLPNTLIESLYFHRPVIVPEWGSFLYTTSTDVAFRYKALSFESLAGTICGILDNPSQIEVKTDACEDYYTAHYSENSHIESLEELFTKTLNHEDI